MSEYSLLLGDSLTVLKTLPANSVQCAITSPPYFGLRSYLPDDHPDKALEIGTEQTPEEFVAKLVEVFHEVRRVLHPTGVIWVNLGDSYNGSGGYSPDSPSNLAGSLSSRQDNGSGTKTQGARRVDGLKNKDLLGIPWMCAFALRADGWYLRSAITFCKGNPMPESVTDRCTSATEMVFMLAKSSSYYYDSDAIREPYNANSLSRYKYEFGHGSAAATNKSPAIGNGNGHSADPNPAGRNRRNWWLINSEPTPMAHYAVMPTKLVEPCILAGSRSGDTVLDPFFGSGTVGAVALKHGRNFIGIDLDPRNIELAHTRIERSQPMLLQVTP